jgi:Holliday junction DNA helicase RuvA
MIAQLTGNLIQKNDDYAILDVNGVGYQVFVPTRVFGALGPAGTTVTLFTHHHIRENSQELYGFLESNELDMFELLLTISGVGPKAGMGILSQVTPEEIARAVSASDVTILTKVSGVGKKTAERIVLELKNKLDDFSITSVSSSGDILAHHNNEALDALLALGCSEREALEALRTVDVTLTKTEDQVKAALRFMGAR